MLKHSKYYDFMPKLIIDQHYSTLVFSNIYLMQSKIFVAIYSLISAYIPQKSVVGRIIFCVSPYQLIERLILIIKKKLTI